MAAQTIRRYTIHPPQLVGRISVPRPKEDVAQALRRLVGEYDGAMQELQRFLKYLQDANDTGQVAAGVVGVVDGSVDHHEVLNLADGDDHPHYLKEKLAGGLASEIPIHDHSSTAEAGVVAAGDVSFAPHGPIAAVDVQAAIEEIVDEEVLARGGTLYNPSGISSGVNVCVWRAPYSCTVLAVKGYRVGGTGATINARKNGASNHLATDLSLTSADTWLDGGAVQNATYAAGDKLEIMLVTVAGAQIGRAHV